MSSRADDLLNSLAQGQPSQGQKFDYASLHREAGPTDFATPPNADALLAQLANSNPAMSTAEDMGRSAVSGAQQGITGTVAAPGDARDLLERAAKHAGIDTGAILKSVSDFADKSGSLPLKLGATLFAATPNSQALNAARQSATGPDHAPQTTPGRYAQRVAQMLPAAAMTPGGLVTKGATVLASGVGSRLGEDIAPERYKPLGAALGAMVGAGGVQAARNVANAPQRLMAQSLRNTSSEQLQAATELQRKAAAMGVHLTPPEALAQVTNGANTMTRLQHFVENSPQGEGAVADIFTNRPAQLNSAVGSVADQIAPADMAPSASGLNNQQAAADLLRRFDRLRSTATGPLYRAADAQTVPTADIEDLHDAITSAIQADKTGKIGSVLGQFQADLAPNGQPLTDIGSLDTIRKIWRDKFDLPPNADGSLLKTQAAKVGPFIDQLDTMMEGASPQFQQGKALHGALSRDVVNPVNNGPVGAIADATQIPAQRAAMFPASPPEGAANETAMAARLLPSDVTANLARHNLIDTWNTANTDLVKGENQWAGGRFAKQIAGHDEQAKALAEGLRALPNGEAVKASVDDLLDVARATARREPPGSGTAFNLDRRAQFGMSPPISKFVGGALDPLEWGKSLDKAVGGALYKRQVKQIADMLRMSPDEAEAVMTRAHAQASQGGAAGPVLLAPTIQERR